MAEVTVVMHDKPHATVHGRCEWCGSQVVVQWRHLGQDAVEGLFASYPIGSTMMIQCNCEVKR